MHWWLCTVCQYFNKLSTLYACKIYFFSKISKYRWVLFILHWYWTLYQMPTYKPNLTCTGYIHNRCTKSPAVCFGTPCLPSLGSKLDVLDIVYSFCLLGDLFIYYVKYYCIINPQCVWRPYMQAIKYTQVKAVYIQGCCLINAQFFPA